MSKIIAVVPSGHNVGLTSAALGLLRALEKSGHKVGFVKPIAQPLKNDRGPERSTALAKLLCNIDAPAPIDLAEAQHLLSTGNESILLENIVDMVQSVASKYDVVIVEGLVSSQDIYYSKNFNQLLVKALDAEIIFVAAPNGRKPDELAEAIEIEYRDYTKDAEAGTVVCGCIINKVSQSEEDTECTQGAIARTKSRDYGTFKADVSIDQLLASYKTAVAEKGIEVLSVLPVLGDLIAPRTHDFANLIDAHALRNGDWLNRRVKSIAIISMTLNKSVYYFQDGALIVTTGDRVDTIIGACMAALNGVKLAGILLCGGFEPDAAILRMCERAFVEGLPLLSLPSSSYETALKISRTKIEIPLDDKDQSNRILDTVASYIDQRWLTAIIKTQREHRVSPPEFRSQLIRLAKEANKRIVLPEGDEPRTVRAAITCFERGIARPVLLGSYDAIQEIAARQELTLPADIEIIDPVSVRGNYIDKLVEMRKSKGMTPEMAAKELEDNVMLGTMMLKLGEVDGLVSGAVHTTANTIRPALQIIKMTPESKLVSSIFFMCLPNQVLVFGDCAINPNPTAEELADIAIQSYDSAVAFRITPRMGMISYSTGASGAGSDVDKVRAATELVKSRRPDIVVDGPLQYDAATTESVAKSKAPNSPVAGRATVMIFPDLNTGNTTYKAVQRSAGVISIGPMLQGLAKPVNDLSRGALVEDIVYTIALTAIQAVQMEQREAMLAKK